MHGKASLAPQPAFQLHQFARPAEKALAYLFLPIFGALVAHTLTTQPATGPFHLVHVAEAPPAEVAGARATGNPGDAGIAAPPADPVIDVSLLPAGAVDSTPDTVSQVRLTAAGGVITTPDGIQLRMPTGPVAALAPAAPAAPIPEGVAGVTDPPQPQPGPASPADLPSDFSLSYRPIDVPVPTGPSPRILRAFALSASSSSPSAAAGDPQSAASPVSRFYQPLTITVPYDPAAGLTGRLALAIFEPDTSPNAGPGAWVELPVGALNERRATVSAQTYRPGIVALVENRPPLPLPDAAQTLAGAAVTINVLANDADPDGDSIAVFDRTTTSAAGGAVHCATTSCVYTPPPGFTGTDTFTYGLGDRRSHPSGSETWTDNTAESTVTVFVRPAGR